MLDFEDFVRMESELGISLITAFKQKQMFVMVAAFVLIVADLEGQDAYELVDQHIKGGGNIIDLMQAFTKAAGDSDFFSKMLGMDKKEEANKGKSTNRKKLTVVEAGEDDL